MRRHVLGLVAALLFLPTLALAQVTTLSAPSIRYGGIVTLPTTVQQIGYDSSTGLPCIVASTANCSAPAAGLPAGAATSANQVTMSGKLDTLHTDLIAPTPAGEFHIGEVGGNSATVNVPQTVTAASAYASGNAVGGLQTIAGASRVAAGSGLVQSVMIYTKTAQTGAMDVVVFSANPTASTCTDKTAFSVAAADFDKVLGVAHVTDWTSLGTPSAGQAQTLAMPFALASGSTIYACAVTRSTPTYGSTSDVSTTFRILRN